MGHLIRKHMADADGEWPLDGDIEADETYVGGRTTGGKRGRGAPNKTVVFGMLERGGDVMTKVVPNVRMKTLQPIIEENVVAGSTVHTDELKSYNGLSKAVLSMKRSIMVLANMLMAIVIVNGIEGFWARLKLSIRGTHVHVSAKHLQKYVKEFEFRYNRRKRPGTMFGDLVARF